MRFLNPVGFFALLLSVPIVLLYMLRLHRRNVDVPSVYLWDAVVTDRHANRPWQKLRRNWLLILQLLILTALALSLARPGVPAPLALHGQVIVLLDVSASMQATLEEGGPTRFDAALHELNELAATLDPADRVALIAVGPVPRLLLQGGDAAALRRSLGSLVPSDAPADWAAAAGLAAGLASGDSVSTLLLTDSAIDEVLPSLPGRVRLISVGDAAENAGIVAFALRRGHEGLNAFVRVQNTSPQAVERVLALYADGVLLERQTLLLPAGDDLSITFPGVPVGAWAEVHLEGEDALAVDDRAWVALSAAGSGRALMVTSGNQFLEQALRFLPDVVLEQTTSWVPAEQDSAESPSYGVIVVDGPITETLPAANLWLIAPGEGSPCGEPGAVVTPTSVVRGLWTHSLLQYVDWSDVHVARARAYVPPADADILLQTSAGPLLWILERPGQRVACMAFNLQDSDLPLRLAFPMLTTNLMSWLMPQISSEPLLPFLSGQPWWPPLPAGTTRATLFTPDNLTLDLSLDGAYIIKDKVGLYRVESETESGQLLQYAALALLDPTESDLHAREVRIGEGQLLSSSADAPGWRDLSREVTLCVLLLLLLEAAFWWGGRWRSPLGVRADVAKSTSWLRQVQAFFARHFDGAILLRLAMVLCLLLAFLGVRFARRTRDLSVVFILDRSASTREAWDAQVSFVEQALARKAARDRVALVVFGGDAWVDRPLSLAPNLSPIATLPRVEATDIEDAVRLALALIPEQAPGRLVLLSDGLETSGRASGAWREAESRGVDLLVVQAGLGSPGAEVWISDLRLPVRAYPGDRVPVAVDMGGNVAQSVILTWATEGQAGEAAVELDSELGTLVFSVNADGPGFMPLRACVAPEVDTFVQNNCADGWVLIEGAPRILVVGQVEEREPMAQALRQAGLGVVEATPGELPFTVHALADYVGIVLVNTPARDFSSKTLEAIRAFVRDFGGGLVAVGGPESYGVGGWLGTPLEEALPVEMRVQDPRRFPPLVMVIVIDKSGSMAAEEGGIAKIKLAAEAAIRVAETLNDTDVLAVVAYDDRPADTFGPVTMEDRETLIAQLSRLQSGGGGIYVRDSMVYAESLFSEVDVPAGTKRHILLLADGSDAEQQEGVLAQVTRLQQESDTTVSVVSIGPGSDVPFLQSMAKAGSGRFYLANYAADLPTIFAEEAARAKRSYIVEELFYPQPGSTWLPVSDITAAPPLQGYIATTPKSAAQVVWRASDLDPLLAVWQYGLGRSVAWTSDASGRWASEWVAWDSFAEFWGGVVRDVLPPPSDSGLVLRVIPDGDMARLVADVSMPDNGYADGLDLQVQVAIPGEDDSQTISLRQVAPGRYEGRFAPPAQGALLLRLHGDRNLVAGWAPPASLEYLPGDAEAALLRLLAQGGAGALSTDAADAFVHNLRGVESGQPLAPLLLLFAVILWPVDIAWRRLSLTRADLVRAWAKLRSWIVKYVQRRKADAVTPPEAQPTLAARVHQQRRKSESQDVVVPMPGASVPPAPKTPTEEPGASSSAPAQPSRPAAATKPAAKGKPEVRESLATRLKRRIREDD